MLTQQLAAGCSNDHGLSSMSVAIYDTAWVAMISKIVDGRCQWLYPSSFQHLVHSQAADGGWGQEGLEIDAILNTMAALLALKRHHLNPGSQNDAGVDNLDVRIIRATSFLQSKLESWNVEAADHVGFEILVPTLLRLLADEGINFEFAGQKALARLNSQKLEHFDFEILYGSSPTTLLHSLEAFAGQIDFDKLIHRLHFDSMMASPSSTAAYLIYATQWDDRAEEYIRLALASGLGKQSGAVPSAFPSTIFELTWERLPLVRRSDQSANKYYR